MFLVQIFKQTFCFVLHNIQNVFTNRSALYFGLTFLY